MKKCFEVFKFECKLQLKSAVLWLCVVLSAYVGFSSYLLFAYPVKDTRAIIWDLDENSHLYETNIDEFILSIFNKPKNEKNPYSPAEARKYARDDLYFEKDLISVDDYNKNLDAQIKNAKMRFSQLFFRGCSYILASEGVMFLLCAIFVILLYKDKTSLINDLVHSRAINPFQYVLGKFMSAFALYAALIFLGWVGFGFREQSACLSKGWDFHMLDVFPSFFIYFIPTLLFSSSLITLLSVVFKNAIIAIPAYLGFIALVGWAQERVFTENIGFSIFPKTNHKMIYTGPLEFLPSYIVKNQIILVISSLIFLMLTCYFWHRNSESG